MQRYKAAGVLLYQFMGPSNELHVLMGRLSLPTEITDQPYRQRVRMSYSFLGALPPFPIGCSAC